MNTLNLLKIHEQCIDCVDAIRMWEEKIKSCRHTIKMFNGWLDDSKFRHNIEIYQNCQMRIGERYAKLITELAIEILE